MLDGALGGVIDGGDVHAVHFLARNAEGRAALVKMRFRAGARDGGAHSVLVVLDNVDDRQVPELGHIKALIDLALVGRAIAEIGRANLAVLLVLVREGEPGAERDLRAHNAVTAKELLVTGEHVHAPALAFGIAAFATGQFSHHPVRIHAGGQHVGVVAIAGDHLITLFESALHADDNRFLADIEVAEARDQTHAVELAGLLLEAAHQEHVLVPAHQLVLAHIVFVIARGGGFARSAGRAFRRHIFHMRTNWLTLPVDVTSAFNRDDNMP